MRFEGANPSITKLIGIYERELWPVIDVLPELGIQRIVNVGAADGYYAVGLARLLPNSRTIAFEIDAAARAALDCVVNQNGVESRVSIRGGCDPVELGKVLSGDQRSLVVCDVEGYERVLLDPAIVPVLTRCYILVELHDFLEPGVSGVLRARFSGSHELKELNPVPRSIDEFPYATLYLEILPKRYRLWAVNEGREGATNWLWMTPKSPGMSR